MSLPTRFTVEANVAADCGHIHRSYETAKKCLDRLGRTYSRLPGGTSYYDGAIQIVRPDGTTRDLTPDEWDFYNYEPLA